MDVVFKIIMAASILIWALVVTVLVFRINAREKRLMRMLAVGKPELPNPPAPLSADEKLEFARKVVSYNCSSNK